MSGSRSSNASTPRAEEAKNLEPIARTPTHTKHLWKFRLRPDDDDEPQDWWFASTAIPLLAATIGPLANVMSIAALITSWRCKYDPGFPGEDAKALGLKDPRWCVGLNAASLACGFAGNIFLLFNFTRRVRYMIALPATIFLWYLATGIVSISFFVEAHASTFLILINHANTPHNLQMTDHYGFSSLWVLPFL